MQFICLSHHNCLPRVSVIWRVCGQFVLDASPEILVDRLRHLLLIHVSSGTAQLAKLSGTLAESRPIYTSRLKVDLVYVAPQTLMICSPLPLSRCSELFDVSSYVLPFFAIAI